VLAQNLLSKLSVRTSIQEHTMNSGSPPRNRSRTLLVVDDDPDMRELLQTELESQGFAVLTAMNGAEAVATAKTMAPDVILMDILMPVMDGIEAIRKLKANETTRPIPILILTIVDNRENLIAGLEAGAQDYITKPFFLPELKARVTAALRFKLLYDELLSIKEQIIRREHVKIIQELTSTMQHSNNELATVILGKIGIIRRNEGMASPEDLDAIEQAVYQINSTFHHLDILHMFAPLSCFNNQEIPSSEQLLNLDG
jgi:DNA-binding response OmpR family regulator